MKLKSKLSQITPSSSDETIYCESRIETRGVILCPFSLSSRTIQKRLMILEYANMP